MAHHETGSGLAFDEITLTFLRMKLLIRTLLVLAALAYVAMPLTGMATVVAVGADAIVAATVVKSDSGGHAAHGQAMHSGAKVVADAAQADGDCPHPGKTDRSPHCAACLTLPAELKIADAGGAPRAGQAPAANTAFSSWPAAPLDPPPRA